ncbi:hypothetical protein MICRO11B_160005 [Micrococcus luteus]|nr:hypothetical protein MICRO11B_160005 [Micrococcus luteus]
MLGWNHSTTADPTASRGPGLRCPGLRRPDAPCAVGRNPAAIHPVLRTAECGTPSGSVESGRLRPVTQRLRTIRGGATAEFTP